MLKNTEKLEHLGANIKVIVSPIHRFWTDTIILADFAMPKPHETAVDLGTGCGTIPLLWCRETPPKHITAIEIQSDGADLARRSVQLNSLDHKIDVINDDLRNIKNILPHGQFDLVVCNPPYKHIGSGIVNPHEGKKTARHETTCTIEDVAFCAKHLLRFGGRLCICQRPERLCDVIDAMRKASIEPKRIRFVQANVKKAPKLLLVEGKLGANKGGLVTMPTLIIDENICDEMTRIYKCYRESTGGQE